MSTEHEAASRVPVLPHQPILSFKPLVLPSARRLVPLQVRVTVPVTGRDLPALLLSHGHGNSHVLSSLNGDAPLADRSEMSPKDDRIAAGVLLAAPGQGRDLAPTAAERYPVLHHTTFKTMAAPALVVVGDRDVDPAFSTRPDWRADAHLHSPGTTCLLTLHSAEHGLGGVAGYDAAETTDEHPGRVALLQRLTWAYLRTALEPTDSA
ncbi:hypothetical protein [Deinococcus sedimenti]|uniref:Alpha/beta hydrolase n=1 Tax=Deinococcus sedimenti TaxID=1867090 RepID=A0ABQ2S4B4_9DEIO|nr:hypothetical protein [Deinococcus sedimenti]GGR93316.1 hypothetical protein GCM10008960_20380 [Deinococcus sedimenti]